MGDVDKSWRSIRDFSLPEIRLIYADSGEPTSGLEPLTCSLRVIHQAFQGCAADCNPRISRPISLLCLAECCTVLRSRWYQSGIKDAIFPRRLWRPWGYPINLLASRSDRAPSRGPHNCPTVGRVRDPGVVLTLIVARLRAPFPGEVVRLGPESGTYRSWLVRRGLWTLLQANVGERPFPDRPPRPRPPPGPAGKLSRTRREVAGAVPLTRGCGQHDQDRVDDKEGGAEHAKRYQVAAPRAVLAARVVVPPGNNAHDGRD